jgi:hypothetical protein
MENYSAGTFLYGIPSSEESASYHPEDQRVFLHDGCNTADGYGILIGWADGNQMVGGNTPHPGSSGLCI